MRNVQLRQGDVYAPPAELGAYDLVVIHQVLHFLDDPGRALAEAARLLRPGGRLIVVDFAAHEEESLREHFAHRRLGFSGEEIAQWMTEAGLSLVETRRIEPDARETGKLTVVVWLARDPRFISDSAQHLAGVRLMLHTPTRPSRSGSPIRASFEFFPPKSQEMETTLWEAIKRLEPLSPDFVSVTYGAGGSTRARTHSTVEKIARDTYLRPAAHLTCVGASKGEVDDVIREYWDAGVRHIVALRGDSPGGVDAPYVPHPQGYQRTEDGRRDQAHRRFRGLRLGLSRETPQSPTLLHDIDMLKRKMDAGADRAITQLL